MDSRTHVELAIRLLSLSGGPRDLAVASLFPQIDRRPSTLHRLFAHTAFKAAALTDLGLRTLFQGPVSGEEKAGYAHGRFLEERARLTAHLGGAPAAPRALAAGELPQGIMAFVSHLYLDTFNQPTQAFMPVSVQCCGQWALWEKLGDFRLALYTTGRIDRLRDELFADPLWRGVGSFSAAALTLAMLRRMTAASQRKIPPETADAAMDATGMAPPDPAEAGRAFRFLADVEALLCALHVKHLAASADVSRPLAHAG